MASIKRTTPPGTVSAYVLPCFTGELWTIPSSNSVMRLLVTGAESENSFAVVGTGGTADKPVGFHYHREAHDVFLCLKGQINVWANDQARTLSAGDFASVPPNTIHQYQVLSAHSEFIGLIVPGGWEEFFRFIGEPYSGGLFPTNDKRNPFEVLIPKLMAATERFDMVPVRAKAQFAPQPWDGSEKSLPGICESGGYFLREGEGKRHVVGGLVVRPLATTKEAAGRFSLYDLQGSKLLNGTSSWGKTLEFEETHHAWYVVDGVWKLVVDGQEVKTTAGETSFVPAGTKWTFEADSAFARAYMFANGGGVGEVLTSVGEQYTSVGLPQESDVTAWDDSRIEVLQAELKFEIR